MNCSGNRKTADFVVRLPEVARELGWKPRRLRDACKAGLIPGAVATPGGHWRIHLRRPLHAAVPRWLWKLRANQRRKSKPGQPIGSFEEELVEWRLLAWLYAQDVYGDDITAVPYLHDLADPLFCEQVTNVLKKLVGQHGVERSAQDVQREFVTVLQATTKNPRRRLFLLRDLILKGVIYECWRESDPKLPTATAVMGRMGVSRGTFYDRYRKRFKRVRREVLGRFFRDPPTGD